MFIYTDRSESLAAKKPVIKTKRKAAQIAQADKSAVIETIISVIRDGGVNLWIERAKIVAADK